MVTKTSTTTDTRSVAELEQAVVAGDLSITAEQLAAARDAEHHAALQREAQVRREHAAAAAARDGEIEKLRGEYRRVADEKDEITEAGVAAVAAVERVFMLAQNRGRRLDELAARARSLGIVEMGLDDVVRDVSGLGWRKSVHMAGPAHLRVDDKLLAAPSPVKLVARTVHDAFVRVGQRIDNFSLKNSGASIEELAAAQVREITPPKLRRLRVAKRWGQNQVGDIVEVDGETAKWALQREFATPA
jgi:hypothetical protein